MDVLARILKTCCCAYVRAQPNHPTRRVVALGAATGEGENHMTANDYDGKQTRS